MINRRLSSKEAAERLGVKPATLYAYVSRGLLHPERGPAGSTFDVQEVARLARSARNPGTGRPPARREAHRGEGAAGGRADADEPVFVTELSLIAGGRLYYRGLDAVELSRRHSFEEVAAWLWTGSWPDDRSASPAWQLPPASAAAVDGALAALPPGVAPLERFMAAVVAASAHDDLRHDLSPAGVPVTGRCLLAVLAAALPLGGQPIAGDGAERGLAGRGLAGQELAGPGLAERVWLGVCRRRPDRAGIEVIDAALVLAADHELAPSTLAARVAASFRADPYAVVLTGLGPASGSWQAGSTGAPSRVEELLADAERDGPERAIGERLRAAGGVPHGFGMPLYPDGDPRAVELLRRLEAVAPHDRWAVVSGVVALARDRGFPPPNFDLGLGALSYCLDMLPGSGQAVSTLAKASGWVAHAMEEYAAPTRFRSRADYVGPAPDTTPAS